MALLPKYQKTGIRVRQASGMDFAAERERQRQSGVISQQLERMGKFAFERGAEMAERRGQERVREQGAVATLEQMQERGGVPFTIEQKAAYEAANRVAVVEIETAARSDMRELITQADQSNMSMAQFNERMSDIRDGYSASLQLVDPVAAGVLSARLQEDSATFDSRYSEIVTRKAKAAWAANTEIILNEGAQTVVDTALQEGVTAEQIKKAGENLLATARTRGVSEKKAQKLVEKTVNAALRENLIYRFNEAAGIKERQALLAELEKSDTFAGMNYEQSFNFKNRLANEIDRQITVGRNTYVAEAENALVVLQHTGELPENFDATTEDAEILFQGDEETFDTIARSLEYAQKDVLTYGALSTMSVEQANNAEAEIKAEYEEAKQRGDSGEVLNAMQKRLVDFQTAKANRADRINADPAQYVIETNKEARLAATKAMQALQSGNLQAAAAEINALSSELSVAYDQIGVRMEARQIMPGNMAKSIVAALEGQAQTNPDLAVSLFGQYREAFGENSMRFVDELSRAGLKPEFTEAMLSNDPGLHTKLMEISQRSTQEIKDLAGPEANDTYKLLQEKVSDYTAAFIQGGGAKAQDDIAAAMGVAEKLLYQHMAETGQTMDKAAQYVVERLFPEYENIVNDVNGSYIVPIEFNKNTVDALLAGQILRADVLEKMGVQPLDVLGAEGYIDEAVSFTNLARQGVWLNNSTGDGVVLHYKTKQGHLIKAKMQDGSEVDLKFKDLRAVVNELQGTDVEVERAEPVDAAQTVAPGFGPGSPGFEAGMAALEEAQPVDTGARFTAEPVSAEERVKQAKINQSKVRRLNSFIDKIPEGESAINKQEYYNFLRNLVSDPNVGRLGMPKYEYWKKKKLSGELIREEYLDEAQRAVFGNDFSNVTKEGKNIINKYLKDVDKFKKDKYVGALRFDEWLKTQE